MRQCSGVLFFAPGTLGLTIWTSPSFAMQA